jgi:hypothetical protein
MAHIPMNSCEKCEVWCPRRSSPSSHAAANLLVFVSVSLSLFGRRSSYKKICCRARATRFDPPSEKGLRCRISPTCTLSQNGYGANWGGSLLLRSTFCTRACKSESLRGSFVKTGTIRRRFACSPRKDDTRGSRSVDDTLFRLASRLFGPSANGNGTALFATAGVGAKLISERRHLLGRAGRNLISNAFASMGNSSGALCFSFASTSGARDSLGKGGAMEQRCRVCLVATSGTRRNIARPRGS